MNNHNTSTLNTNKLDLDNGYNKQHTEIPSISQIPSQDESYWSKYVTKTVTRQYPTITDED